MEARDLSRSGKEGQGDDDEGVLVATYGMAKDAAVLFEGGLFAECVEVLNQILEKKEGDPKVLHNIAIAEYFRDGCLDPRKLLELLNKVKSEDLAHASREDVEVASSPTNNEISEFKGSGVMGDQLSSARASSTPFADIFDASIITFNTAVVLYHLHDYAHALSLLEPLYDRLHPVDETTALHVCFLLINIALASNDATRAADVIQYVERSFGVGFLPNQGDNGGIQAHSQPLMGSPAPPLVQVAADSSPAAAAADPSAGANAPETTSERALLDDSIEYETLFSTLNRAGELSRAPPAEWPAATVDLRLKLHLLKVELLLLTRNLKAVKREVKQIMNVARGRDLSIALLLKSQLEYVRGNHRKAVKLLQTAGGRAEPGLAAALNNNLACIYSKLEKHHSAVALLGVALRGEEAPPLKQLFALSQNRPHHVLYNCGLQHLTCGKPLTAARCLCAANRGFGGRRPLLWLRLAECFLLAREKDERAVELQVVGSGKWRQLAVNPSCRRENPDSSPDGGGDDDCRWMLSAAFARQCLLNALHLLEEAPSPESSSTNGEPRETKGCSVSSAAIQSSVAAYEEICRRENQAVKQAALADLAYTELCLGSHLRALAAATALQRLPYCSKAYAFLGRTYAAEAFCRLNLPGEASEQLSVYVSEQGSALGLSFGEDDVENWPSEKAGEGSDDSGAAAKASGRSFLRPEEARAALYVNLAALSAVRGDLQQAENFSAEALSAAPTSPEALLTAVYVDLRLGKTSDALLKLRQSRGSRFLPDAIKV
ncbi:unnamed protein product [Spirodela intermedia]|uniref:Uncharacterized protein n=1 Tax=Spirodela intermedia TaxID=51605 RepID=A0A7I8IWD7_SPIIN|nr:unnamed protein product [Spirodela intermedia]CAA6661451.1 unnamed protein product [Spirodela intermedia]